MRFDPKHPINCKLDVPGHLLCLIQELFMLQGKALPGIAHAHETLPISNQGYGVVQMLDRSSDCRLILVCVLSLVVDLQAAPHPPTAKDA
jgi:hypothetical protein